jgi:Trypsin Inhibitor like cysteine rich domain
LSLLKNSGIFTAPDYLTLPCFENEVLNECGKPDFCDGTCDNPKAVGIKCPKLCVRRCECKPGYVRAKYNSDMRCVPIHSCPRPRKNIAGFCTVSNALKEICPKYAKCPDGYQLRRKGRFCCCEEFTIRKFIFKIISRSLCQSIFNVYSAEKVACSSNEIATLPAPAEFCEGTCANPNGAGIDCPPPHGERCTCRHGYVRISNTNRRCVKLSKCGHKGKSEDNFRSLTLTHQSFLPIRTRLHLVTVQEERNLQCMR